MHTRIEETAEQTPLKTVMESAPTTSRLKSRNPFPKSKLEAFNLTEEWKAMWNQDTPKGGDIIPDPTARLPGFQSCNRKQWVTSNRLLTGHGRTAANMHRWGLKESDMCRSCQGSPETTDHIVLHCRVTGLAGGYETILRAEEDFKT